jgi:hypothetical protein
VDTGREHINTLLESGISIWNRKPGIESAPEKTIAAIGFPRKEWISK